MDGIYIDTNFLIDAVIGRDEERSIQQGELERIMSIPMQVHIPQIILGESFAVIARESSSNNLQDNISTLTEWIRRLVPKSDIITRMPSINSEIIEMARAIREEDNRMDWTDAIFISHAFLDQDARTVYTKDRKIHDSNILSTRNEEREDKSWPKLSVKDSVGKKKRLRRRGY